MSGKKKTRMSIYVLFNITKKKENAYHVWDSSFAAMLLIG
jgi:hypothetical protein